MEEGRRSESREFDVVILGASGFTGKYVVREALKFLNSPSSPLKTLALAGRSPSKLSQTLSWASSPTPPPHLPILQADVSDFSSLLSLSRRTRLLLNCVGPFRLHGQPVVAACVESGTDYLDITGEPEFMEKMEALYHDKAREAGSLVISACGYDSVPAEMGLIFNSLQWVSPAAPNRVEAYLSLESERKIVGNFATLESLVLGVANVGQLQELRRSRPRRARPVIPGPPPPKGPIVEHQKSIGRWAVKLPSADAIVVRRTLSSLTENPDGLPGVNEDEDQIERRKNFWVMVKPAHFGVKIVSKSLLGIVRYIFMGILIGLFATFAFGQSLLLKYPQIFTLGMFRKTGPTEEEVNSATFKMWFVGHGYSDSNLASREKKKPDMEIITRVSGPEIGYVTTPIILLQCALILLGQRDKLPQGGVLTPGIVFGPTDLQNRLQQNGISFDIVARNALPA
ncbi:putative mitochondrial saccharopine dehydrogenase-like protein oxidoreductase [Cinnamomum micranthum f. kanehirae]|uniref:Putative mitochondrial saccharopine dehydrogenase-like protein oxidoreductase n=1 Tax=Cinnamomum micranthum f. kanehirae TaxID=337451 RepID=A0A443NFI0_9MAGN|nr:putative mitochondrial saccharopine dehydrogenase-like protein oxidoreductase [Cinnamomum micranthum f. kanehirae]